MKRPLAACVVIALATSPHEASDLARSVVLATEPPLRFESNLGQWSANVRFVARGGGSRLFIGDDGMHIGGVTMKLTGAAPARLQGEHELAAKSHFFVGDHSTWRVNVPNYAQVRAAAWRRGVDVVWHSGRAGLEYDLEIAASAACEAIGLDVQGASALAVADNGALRVTTAEGTLVQDLPTVVQGGRRLSVRYAIDGDARVAFEIDGCLRQEPLLVDPVLTYSTYLGGTANDDGNAVAVDGTGAAFVVGATQSTDFPVQGAAQPANAGSSDAFITKLDASGASLVYSTYLGGAGDDGASAVAVDVGGNVYITGVTNSTNFPVFNAFQSTNRATCSGCTTAFVTKLDATGALTYSTYLGGSGGEVAQGIAVDGSGDAFVTGSTQSTDFPTLGAFQSSNKGAADAFITKLAPAGTTLLYSTYLGGSALDLASAIAVDGSGNAYVTGSTTSTNFPALAALQAASGGGTDVFVTELASTGSALVYSTYLGGTGADVAHGVALDGSGSAYVAGSTTSTNFPTRAALQASYTGGNAGNAFVTKLAAGGSGLVYSTYLGGSSGDAALGIAVDKGGSVFVAGQTSSTTFPTVNAVQSVYAGGGDAFATMLAPTGAALAYSTFLGGSGADAANGIAIDSIGNAFLVGTTGSIDFPTNAAFQSLNVGNNDVFVSKIAPMLAIAVPCGVDGECISSHCIDGFCCGAACSGQCEACDVVGHFGTCTPVKGEAHGVRQSCPTHGACVATCDGTDTSQCTYLPNVCASTCTNAVETDSTCDSTGNCGNPTPHPCSNGMCTNAMQCQTSCTVNAQCPSGAACVSGSCVAPVCVDDQTSRDPLGQISDCSPYVCTSFGACGTSCLSSNDCVAPATCNAGGQCTTTPPGGCSCGVGNDGSGGWLLALAGFGCAALAARGRRRRRQMS